MASRALGCLAMPVVLACNAQEPLECDVRLPDACWLRLGFDGHWVGSVAETPWGLFAGTDDAGLFRFDEPAGNWVSLGLDHAQISSIVFVPGPPDKLLVGVRPYADEQTDAAVFASEDRGATWAASDGGLAMRNDRRFWAYSLGAAPTQPPKIFMGSSASVSRSDDGGRTWSFVFGDEDLFGPGITAIAIPPATGGRVWAGGTAPVFLAFVVRLEQWGERWEQFFISRNRENAIFALALDPNKADRMWAGVWVGVVRSDDAGETWTYSLRLPEPDFPVPSSRVAALAVDGDALYGASVEHFAEASGGIATRLGLYVTRDGGGRWDTLRVPDGVRGAHSMIVDSEGRLLIGTARSGLWRVTRYDR